MSNVVSFTTPLLAAGTVSSSAVNITRALNVTGTVFSDVSGTVYIDQGGDGTNWDFTTSYAVTGGTGLSFNVDLVDQYFRVRYINGGSNQTIFRLFANPRDPFGAFLTTALPPSAGGAYGVLFNQDGSYSWVGRFDGLDEFDAITNAALSKGQSGKYAAFVIADSVVSDETIVRSTEHSPDAF